MTVVESVPSLPIRHHVRTLPGVEVGGTASAQAAEQGIRRLVRLNSNEGPFEPFPEALEAMATAARQLNRYPNPTAQPLVEQIAREFDLARDQVVVEAGSSQLIFHLAQALLGPGDELVYPWPSFPVYGTAALRVEGVPVRVPLQDDRVDLDGLLRAITPRTRLVVVCNPNNPTGTMVTRAGLDRFLDAVPAGVAVILDEAYAEFADDFFDGFSYVRAGCSLVVLRTFSKIYGLAGVRVGYAAGPLDLVGAIKKLQAPYAVSHVAMAAALASLPLQKAVQERAEANRRGREQLTEGFRRLGLTVTPSQTNFIWVQVGDRALDLFKSLMERGIVVRPGRGYEHPNHLRVTVGLPEENAALLDALADIL